MHFSKYYLTILYQFVQSIFQLEDFSFDMTGQQALNILQSAVMKDFREKFGNEIPVLVEGRIGIIKSKDADGAESALGYVSQLKEAGATGAIVGGGLVPDSTTDFSLLQSFLI
jgi:hypothetical protein